MKINLFTADLRCLNSVLWPSATCKCVALLLGYLINWNPKYSLRAAKRSFLCPLVKSVKTDLAEGYMKTSHCCSLQNCASVLHRQCLKYLLSLCSDSTQWVSSIGRFISCALNVCPRWHSQCIAPLFVPGRAGHSRTPTNAVDWRRN